MGLTAGNKTPLKANCTPVEKNASDTILRKCLHNLFVQ